MTSGYLRKNRMKRVLFLLLIIVVGFGCIKKNTTEKHQNTRNNKVDMHISVKDICTNDILIGNIARLYTIDDYLFILDADSKKNLLHIFDIHNFKYIASGIRKGRGPGEITNAGSFVCDESHHKFLLPDYGKNTIFEYDLNKFLANPDNYTPKAKINLSKKQFPSRLQYLNDSIYIGTIITPTGNSGYNQSIAKWNINTGEFIPQPYEHSEIQKKRILFAASEKENLYVEAYQRYDLLTICDLDGNLKWNVYGPEWSTTLNANTPHFFGKPSFCNGKIVVAYSGGDYHDQDAYYPTMFHIFDLEGNYLKTLDVGYKISDYCYDAENNRLIMALNDVIQFAYLDLDGII